MYLDACFQYSLTIPTTIIEVCEGTNLLAKEIGNIRSSTSRTNILNPHSNSWIPLEHYQALTSRKHETQV